MPTTQAKTNWAVIAPINAQHNVLWKLLRDQPNKEFDLGNGIRIAEMPAYIKGSPFLAEAWVGRWKGDDIRSSPTCLISEFEDPVPQPSPGNYNVPTKLLQDAHDAIRIANISLWLAKPSAVGFEYIVLANDAVAGFLVRSLRELRPIVPHVDYQYDQIEFSDLVLARNLNSAWAPLPMETPLGIAKAVTSQALTDDWELSRYLLFWVALEALFAPGSGGEASYRLGLRLSRFLESDSTKTKETYKQVRDSYRWRSDIAHGRGSQKKSEAELRILYFQTLVSGKS